MNELLLRIAEMHLDVPNWVHGLIAAGGMLLGLALGNWLDRRCRKRSS